ncbi:MAG: hypothetical protein JWR61_2978 [Ferruginibacter sp.]|nr:hypothetical protein [Ferruginibacter sp.]
MYAAGIQLILFMKHAATSTINKITAKAIHSFVQHLPAGKSVLLLLLASALLSGCFLHYYKTNTTEQVSTTVMEKLVNTDKYFIVHFPDKIMGLQNVKLANDRLQAELVALPKEHSYYTAPVVNEANKMKAKYQQQTLVEVHLYLSAPADASHTFVTLPLSNIKRLDVYELDAKATKSNRILSIAGVTIGAWVVFTVILLIVNPPVFF